jgi:hypothetical protein
MEKGKRGKGEKEGEKEGTGRRKGTLDHRLEGKASGLDTRWVQEKTGCLQLHPCAVIVIRLRVNTEENLKSKRGTTGRDWLVRGEIFLFSRLHH